MDSDLTAIDPMIRARGLNLTRFNPSEDLLLPPSDDRGVLETYRTVLDHYAARLLLKQIINASSGPDWVKGRRNVERFSTAEAVDNFLRVFKDLDIISGPADAPPGPCRIVRSFGPTFEWYVAQVLWSDFSLPSLWGVTFENTASGGDYDVISSLAGRFLYIELKTSPPGRIEAPEIRGYICRLSDIAPDISVFINDTHLRMKDKIVPMVEEAVTQSRVQYPESGSKSNEAVRFQRLEREVFHLGGVIYITNTKPDLKRNLKIIFRHYFRNRNPVLEAILQRHREVKRFE